MKNRTTFCNKRIILTLFLIAFGLTSAHASGTKQKKFNRLIRGDYAFSVYRTCVQAPGLQAFDRESLILLVDKAENINFVDTGTLRFDGRGKAKTLDSKIIQFTPDDLSKGDFPVTPGLTSNCEGTYTVQSDRSYSAEFTCSAALENGLTLTISPFRTQGQADKSRRILTTSEVQGNIQTVTIKSGDQVVGVSERICITSGTLIRKNRKKRSYNSK